MWSQSASNALCRHVTQTTRAVFICSTTASAWAWVANSRMVERGADAQLCSVVVDDPLVGHDHRWTGGVACRPGPGLRWRRHHCGPGPAAWTAFRKRRSRAASLRPVRAAKR